MKMLARIVKNADGQVLVLFALLMVVIMGFAALVVDAGAAYNTRAKLQKAADAAALAGAQDLTDVDKAVKTAVEYTRENGLNVKKENIVPGALLNEFKASGDTGTDLVTVTTPYVDDPSRIKVVCTTKVKYAFAGVLGGKFKEKNISASAVAKRESQWAGEALPFINLDYDYSITDPIAWTHAGSGIKGTIRDFDIQGSGSNTYFEVEYANGITVERGFSNGVKSIIDKDDKLKDGLDDLLTPQDENIKNYICLA